MQYYCVLSRPSNDRRKWKKMHRIKVIIAWNWAERDMLLIRVRLWVSINWKLTSSTAHFKEIPTIRTVFHTQQRCTNINVNDVEYSSIAVLIKVMSQLKRRRLADNKSRFPDGWKHGEAINGTYSSWYLVNFEWKKNVFFILLRNWYFQQTLTLSILSENLLCNCTGLLLENNALVFETICCKRSSVLWGRICVTWDCVQSTRHDAVCCTCNYCCCQVQLTIRAIMTSFGPSVGCTANTMNRWKKKNM